MLAETPLRDFREIVWNYYHSHARSMPWREDPSPYHVLVSELMLQQTQVGRVLPKYQEFMVAFPTIQSLAEAPLSDVLGVWSGLGYNRRAKFLHAAAHMVVREYDGKVPNTLEGLIRLPGVGANTAGAVLTYAYNQPAVFVETNVRTVFIHHFFADRDGVDDRELLPLVEWACDPDHPREWYWALMDYGTHLKQTVGNKTKQSRHYARQSAFEGSRRQIRGRLLKHLVDSPRAAAELLHMESDERTTAVLKDLIKEGFIEELDGQLRLTGSSKLP